MSDMTPTIIAESLKLEANGIVDFFQIILSSGGTIFLTSDQTKTWNSEIWEGVLIKLSGIGQYGDDQVSRPKLQVQNPAGAYTKFMGEGAFELALIYRFRVDYSDYINNLPVYITQQWQVSRVATGTKLYINLELQDQTNIPNAIIPARTYSPPNFPVVSV